ncbi:MAG: TonB-dependent receptor, partial [Cellvibrionaceae bacterium]|nr:TonB-dependent receptor [Cellvibrionaceae bacterium]
GARKVSGHINGGGETLQGRLAFSYNKRDGFVKNNSAEDDLNGYDRFSFRPSLRWTPTDNVTVDLIYMDDRARDPGTAFLNQAFVFTNNGALSVPDNQVLHRNDVGVDRDVEDLNLTVRWDINDAMSLSYIGSHREYTALEGFDADGIPQEFLNFAADASGDIDSHELRLNFSGEQINGFVGVSQFEDYAKQRVGYSGDEFLFLGCAGVVPGGCMPNPQMSLPYEAEYENRADNTSRSIFGDISYAINDALELTAGLRYTTEDRWSGYRSSLPVSKLLYQFTGKPIDLFAGRIVNTQGQLVEGEIDDNSLLPRLAFNYAVSDEYSAYLTLSKGRRAKVLEMETGSPVIIDPEEVRNVEVGIKGFLAEQGMSFSAAVFYQDYDNFQVRVLNAAGNYITRSAGSATNAGLEADMQWQLNPSLRLFANLAYIDAKVDDDAQNGSYAGNRFRLQPKFSGAMGYLGNWPIAKGLDFTSSATISHRSSVFFDIENTYEQEAITLVKLKAGIAASDERWSLELFADNLFDKEYLIDAGNTGASFGLPTYIQGAPRSYGLQAKLRFE